MPVIQEFETESMKKLTAAVERFACASQTAAA